MKKYLLVLILGVLLQSCKAFWPYKSDFECPIPEGEHCKSLYEINQMVDEGKYAPELYFEGRKKAKCKSNEGKC
jgi:hypothetical protein